MQKKVKTFFEMHMPQIFDETKDRDKIRETIFSSRSLCPPST